MCPSPAVSGLSPRPRRSCQKSCVLPRTEGPQRIGLRRPFVVVPEHVWQNRVPEPMPLGRWLVANTPRGTNLEVPSRRRSRRRIPFIDELDE